MHRLARNNSRLISDAMKKGKDEKENKEAAEERSERVAGKRKRKREREEKRKESVPLGRL